MQILLDDKTLCDFECIISNLFNPLKTFMNKDDWSSVCAKMKLSDGTFFPLPVTLAINKDKVKLDDVVDLVDNTNYLLAKMKVESLWEPDIDEECKLAYGTTDDNHPYVKYKQSHKGKMYVSGELMDVRKVRHYDFLDLRINTEETKKYFKENNWDKIVGFQTRNPMHKAHYELTKYALGKAGEGAKLFLNPVVGETQTVDIDYHTRVKIYKEMIKKYPENEVKLGLLPLAMRMAGPREACLHALIRKNYGCTHFVVGRDHAGPSYKTKQGDKFYGPYDAQDLLFKHAEEIGITPIVSKMIVFNETKGIYQPIDEVDDNDKVLSLSGTEVRRRLRCNEEIPDWFSFPNVVSLLRKSNKKRGICYYFIGLSGSGKTTYANILKAKLLESDPSKEITILDGDIVRRNLSKGLGFTREDRSTNVRRIGYVASEVVKHNGIVICANIAPYQEDRELNKNLIESLGGKYVEIWVDTPLEVCEERDVKGLYKLAREGKIKEFTGISDPFEEPINADIRIQTTDMDEIRKIFDSLI
jgi:sulfate adenylyltransferase